MASRTRASVFEATLPLRFITFDTVEMETPASSATSRIVDKDFTPFELGSESIIQKKKERRKQKLKRFYLKEIKKMD